MPDITSTHLEAAIIDQNAAGAFSDKPYAFVAVVSERGWQLGVAVANERGYHPIAGKTFKSRDEAKKWAKGLNDHIGRDVDSVLSIVTSTMGGARVETIKG